MRADSAAVGDTWQAGLLRGGETMDYLSRREEEGLDGRKPGWGEAQAAYEDLGHDAARLMRDESGVQMGEEKRAARADTMARLKAR